DAQHLVARGRPALDMHLSRPNCERLRQYLLDRTICRIFDRSRRDAYHQPTGAHPIDSIDARPWDNADLDLDPLRHPAIEPLGWVAVPRVAPASGLCASRGCPGDP